MAEPYPTSAEDLKNGIKHVCYEYANLISAAHWSIRGQAPWRTNVDDAFLLGYRKLRDFLLKDERSRWGADILASDYLAPGFARTWTLPTWECGWQAVMDKQLAHITFQRGKEWAHGKWVPQLEGEMRIAWDKFCDVVDPQYKPEFVKQLDFCQEKLGFFGKLAL
jgi:hypothetical protein